MKKITIATALLALTVGGAVQAADMPVKAPRAAPAAVYSWTGCYIGVTGGGATGRSRHVSGDPATFGLDVARYDISGIVVGGEYGCNWQSGAWVFGTESDVMWTSVDGKANNLGPTFNTTSISGTKQRWLSTSRLRAGFLVGENLLVFATGGLATARVEATVDATVAGFGVISESRTRWGWTAGGGAEYALGGSWSAKFDYLYVRLREKGYFNPPPLGFAARDSVPVQEHVFRIGLNYKFTNCFFLLGCGGPVVARY